MNRPEKKFRLHGDERELTIMARSASGEPVPAGTMVEAIMEELAGSPSLRSMEKSDGIFLAHGHIYPEVNELLEAACADCHSPSEAVRQGALLRHLIFIAADRVRQGKALSRLVISQHNTVYNPSEPEQTTAGHLNVTRYLSLPLLLPDIVAFMCALPCLSGGGGIDVSSGDFTMSVRASRCGVPLSPNTLTNRGVIHSYDSDDSEGVRQQFLAIDNLQSHRQTRAVFAAVHLLIACLESGVPQRPDIELVHPVRDMHSMVTGAKLSHSFTLRDGRRMTGPQILLLYLEWIEKQLSTGILPEWAEKELPLVLDLVTQLNEKNLVALCGVCDHATLFHLWHMTLDTYGIAHESASKYARLISYSWGRYKQEVDSIHELLTEQMSVLKGEANEYWNALHAFMPIAYEYGDIMQGGLFHTLRKEGINSRGVVFTEQDLAQAVNILPPQTEGRCHTRARLIIELAEKQEDVLAGWDLLRSSERGVFDLQKLAQCEFLDWVTERTFKMRTDPNRRTFTALFEYVTARNLIPSLDSALPTIA